MLIKHQKKFLDEYCTYSLNCASFKAAFMMRTFIASVMHVRFV